MKSAIQTLMILLLISSNAFALSDTLISQKTKRIRWYVPDYVHFQFAGNIGFVSAGVGFRNRKEVYQLSLVYGYAPEAVAGVSSHLVTARNIFHFTHVFLNEKQVLIPYGAVGLSWEPGGRSFFTVPENMPPGYYDFPKNIHAIPSVGFKLRHATSKIKGFSGFEVFTELCSVDAYIWYKFLYHSVEFREIVSLAVGIHLLTRSGAR